MKAKATKQVNPPPFKTAADQRLQLTKEKRARLVALREQVQKGKGSTKGLIALRTIHDEFNDETFQEELRRYNTTYRGQQDVRPDGIGPHNQ